MINTQKQNYVLPIAIMFALFFMIAFVTGLPSPIGVIVAKQFGATNFESQLGFFANFIAYAFMGIPAGILLKRKGYKVTALTAVSVGFVGVGIQFLSGAVGSFAVYLTGAFISGFSMCLLNTVVNPMLNTLGGGGNKGNQLIQFGGSLNSIGATIVPMMVGFLMGAEVGRTIEKANPALFIAMGIFAVAFLVIMFSRIPEPHIETAEEKAARKAHTAIKDKYSPLSFRHFILGAVAIFIYVGIEVGIPSTANLYMTSKLGIDAAVAGSVVGTYWFLMMIGRFVGAVVGAKVSSRAMITTVSITGLCFILLAIILPETIMVKMPTLSSTDGVLGVIMADIPIGVMFMALCGLCTSVMWGGIFNLAVEGLGKYTTMASGIFMVMVCGGGIIPLLQGFIADKAGFTNSYWLIFGCMIFLLYYAIVGSKNVNKDISVK